MSRMGSTGSDSGICGRCSSAGSLAGLSGVCSDFSVLFSSSTMSAAPYEKSIECLFYLDSSFRSAPVLYLGHADHQNSISHNRFHSARMNGRGYVYSALHFSEKSLNAIIPRVPRTSFIPFYRLDYYFVAGYEQVNIFFRYSGQIHQDGYFMRGFTYIGLRNISMAPLR